MNESPIQMMKPVSRHYDLLAKFMRWQCLARQSAMRNHDGKPDDAITPELTLTGESEPMGHVIVMINKESYSSKVPELRHMVQRTNDPAQRRDKAIEYFSSTYYQNIHEFSDSLTATFPPGSAGATKIAAHGQCILAFEAFNQCFDLNCKVRVLERSDPMYQATFWHNLLFNPSLHPETVILSFEPDWESSSANPP